MNECWMINHFSCIWLCNPMDCSPQGSSVCGILQARIREWVSTSFSRESSPPRDWIHFLHFLHWQACCLKLKPSNRYVQLIFYAVYLKSFDKITDKSSIYLFVFIYLFYFSKLNLSLELLRKINIRYWSINNIFRLKNYLHVIECFISHNI